MNAVLGGAHCSAFAGLPSALQKYLEEGGLESPELLKDFTLITLYGIQRTESGSFYSS